MTPLHQRILDIIIKISNRQKVVWIHGNHDDGFIPDEIGKIEFKPIYKVNNNLLIAHGHNYDQIMPMSKIFIKAFMRFHQFRIFLGAPPIHVSDYAKKWKLLYSVLLKNVMKNAVAGAKANGCKAVACGHTHYPEDRWVKGIRYLNTGSWTESDVYCVLVENETMPLSRLVIVLWMERMRPRNTELFKPPDFQRSPPHTSILKGYQEDTLKIHARNPDMIMAV